MEVIHLDRVVPRIPSACVTALGFFDGVHRGHRTLLRRTVTLAKRRGAAPCVFTFSSRDPAYGKTSAQTLITTEDERLALFASYGITHVFYANFSAVRDLTPAAFVRGILVDTCHTVTAVCGYNFRFGRSATGNPEALKTLMHENGGRCTVIPPETYRDGEDRIISSSLIRALIGRGDMPTVRRLLSRPYALTATVERGKQLGRTLGFPTVNQHFPVRAVIPAHGVYDVICTVGDARYHGIANVGTRPTVDGGADVNCETHIIGFHGDLYGRVVKIEFLRMLRREERFDSVEELQAAIRKNLEEMKHVYGKRMDKIDSTRRPRRS